MVYFIAAVVVLYNVEEQQQRHYLGHTDDVKWYVDKVQVGLPCLAPACSMIL